MKYIVLVSILCVMFLVYQKISKHLDTGAKILLTVLPVSAIVCMLTVNLPYNELLILPTIGFIIASILDSEECI